jgi:hypothetical protein
MATKQPKQPSGRGRTRTSETPARRKPRDLGPVSDELGPRLRKELESLTSSEAKIVKALANDDVPPHLLAHPPRPRARIGVDVPPLLKQHLKSRPPLPDVGEQRAFRLPNGQVVTARVNVRFTTGKAT